MSISEVIPIRAQLGEGPFWYDGWVYWTDILAKRIFRHFPQANRTEKMQIHHFVGAFAPRVTGGFVLATEDGFKFLSEFNGTVTEIADPERDKPENRFNDGKCDPAGRFWAGTMALDGSKGQGALYMLDTDCTVRKQYSPVTISNGICWSLDRTSMYYIDTPTQRILVFDFDVVTGQIENPRTLVEIDLSDGAPDGMTLDASGCLWIALWGGNSVTCYDPACRKFVHRVNVPASQVTSCAFGGSQLDELYITTACINLDAERLKKEPLAGMLFRTNVGAQGLPLELFRG